MSNVISGCVFFVVLVTSTAAIADQTITGGKDNIQIMGNHTSINIKKSPESDNPIERPLDWYLSEERKKQIRETQDYLNGIATEIDEVEGIFQLGKNPDSLGEYLDRRSIPGYYITAAFPGYYITAAFPKRYQGDVGGFFLHHKETQYANADWRKVLEDFKVFLQEMAPKVRADLLALYDQHIEASKKLDQAIKAVNEVVIEEVAPGTQADDKGLRKGDIIKLYNGRPVGYVLELKKYVLLDEEQKNLEMVVVRDGKEQHLQVTGGRLGVIIGDAKGEKPQ